MAKRALPVHPWDPLPLDADELRAFKALAAGKASEGQQRLALEVIVTKFAGTYDLPFRPGVDGARATDFACGRMFVGQRIVNAIKRPIVEEK